ncbi:MAG TPA: class I SAM-dependent methyltransferase [Myxococcota bacterium]
MRHDLEHAGPERAHDHPIDDEALLRLGQLLQSERYRFTTVTPATHARHVHARGHGALATTLRDVLGWNLPFVRHGAFAAVATLLDEAGALHDHRSRHADRALVRSGVRCASIGEQLFIHGGFPTDAADAVFLGPDTVRFCRLLEQRVPMSVGRVLDIGTGSGAAGIALSSRASSVVLTDTNDEALRLARVNATLAGAANVEAVHSDGLDDVDGDFDLIVVNPPYLADPHARTYRHGGPLGIELGTRFVEEGVRRLTSTGRMIVYTGTPIVGGRDLFFEATAPLLSGFDVDYEEIDPDVFGEEIGEGAYRDVERIAVIALDVRRR